MSNMFKDRVYDEMDDVSRMFEPFQFDLNDELSTFPDRVEVKPEDIMIDDGWNSFRLNLSSFLASKAKDLNLPFMGENIASLINDGFFKFEVENLNTGTGVILDDSHHLEGVKLDASEMTLSHRLFMVKTKIGFDEQELEVMRKKIILRGIKTNFDRARDVDKPRFNEIADIYGAEEVKSERSYYGKVEKFIKHIEKLLDEKVLDLRDITLCNKFVKWIVYYVKNGNLAALNNLTRVKIITHENRPIYSIEEKSIK